MHTFLMYKNDAVWIHRNRGSMHKACVGLRQMWLSALKSKNQHGVPLSTKGLCTTTLTGQGAASFLQWNSTGSTNHTAEPVPCSGVVDKCKMNSMTFLKVWTFCLFSFFMAVLVFCLF